MGGLPADSHIADSGLRWERLVLQGLVVSDEAIRSLSETKDPLRRTPAKGHRTTGGDALLHDIETEIVSPNTPSFPHPPSQKAVAQR
jgi:hypothetical protein